MLLALRLNANLRPPPPHPVFFRSKPVHGLFYVFSVSCLFYLSNLRMLFALRLCERALRPHGGRGEQLAEEEGAPLEINLQRLGVPRLMRDRLQKRQNQNTMRYGKA